MKLLRIVLTSAALASAAACDATRLTAPEGKSPPAAPATPPAPNADQYFGNGG